MLGGVPHGERKHRLRIRGIDDVDEIVIALRVVDRLNLDAQFVEFCLGLLDSLRLFACVLRAQISKQHIFHRPPPRHVDRSARRPCNYTLSRDQRPCRFALPPPASPRHGRSVDEIRTLLKVKRTSGAASSVAINPQPTKAPSKSRGAVGLPQCYLP